MWKKRFSIAIVGPSGSGKTTYLTALMHYFYHHSEWVLRPDLNTSRFYRENILRLEQKEFPPATLESKPLFFELFHEKEGKSFSVYTKDFRGSDLREWLDSHVQNERTKEIEAYFLQADAYLLLAAADDLNSSDLKRYQDDLALFERAIERAASGARVLPPPVAVAVTKADSNPQIWEKLEDFVQDRLGRIHKYLQHHVKDYGSIFAVSAVGNGNAQREESEGQRWRLVATIAPYKVEEPLFFLFEKLQQQAVLRARKRMKWVGLFFLGICFLYLLWGVWEGRRLLKMLERNVGGEFAQRCYRSAERFSVYFPLHSFVMGIYAKAERGRQREIQNFLDWSKENIRENPFLVYQRAQSYLTYSFLSKSLIQRLEDLKIQAQKIVFQQALELEKKFQQYPERYLEVYRNFKKIGKYFGDFIYADRLQRKLHDWRRRLQDKEYWRIRLFSKTSSPNGMLEVLRRWKAHKLQHKNCPYSSEVAKAILEIELKICQEDLRRIEFLAKREKDKRRIFQLYKSYLSGKKRCSAHVAYVQKKIVYLANGILQEFLQRFAKFQSLEDLAKSMEPLALYIAYADGDLKYKLRLKVQKFLRRLEANTASQQFYNQLVAVENSYSQSLEKASLLSLIRSVRLSLEQRIQEKNVQKSLTLLKHSLAQAKGNVVKLRQIQRELWQILRARPEFFSRIYPIFQTFFSNFLQALEKQAKSVLKIQSSIDMLEDLRHQIRQLMAVDSTFSNLKPFEEKASSQIQRLQERLFRSLPVYEGRDLAKLKGYQKALLSFITSNPKSPLVEKAKEQKQRLDRLLELEELVQNPHLDLYQKLGRLEKKFSSLSGGSYPEIFKRVQDFYSSAKQKERRELFRALKDFEEDSQKFMKTISSVVQVAQFQIRLSRAQSLQERVDKYISFWLKKSPDPSLEKRLLQQKQRIRLYQSEILYWFYRLHLDQNDIPKCFQLAQRYLKLFPQGKRTTELRIDVNFYKRILTPKTYIITFHEGDLPDIQNEKPDGYIIFKINGKEVGRTPVITDSWYPKWNHSIRFQWKYGDVIEVWVCDQDGWPRGGDDILGKYRTTKPDFISYWSKSKFNWVFPRRETIEIVREDKKKTKFTYSIELVR
ncbi:MAG: hypothetical protein D6805_02750 [Planctomycetota bacterium]|nr:MAG: hypothetical protein D6805_02750 [Planctomycetota bacterium]